MILTIKMVGKNNYRGVDFHVTSSAIRQNFLLKSFMICFYYTNSIHHIRPPKIYYPSTYYTEYPLFNY